MPPGNSSFPGCSHTESLRRSVNQIDATDSFRLLSMLRYGPNSGRLTYDETPAPARLRCDDRFGPGPRRPGQPRSTRDACSLRAYPPLESGTPELVDLLRELQQPAA